MQADRAAEEAGPRRIRLRRVPGVWWAAARRWWLRFVAFWQEGGERRLPSRRSWAWGDADHLLNQAAERLELTRQDADEVTVLSGMRGELEVRVEVRRIPWKNRETRFEQTLTVRAPAPFAAEALVIEPRERHGPTSVRTRDGAFDQSMQVLGSEDASLAFLSSGLRAAVVGHGGRWTITPSELAWRARRAPNFLVPATKQLIELIEAAVEQGPSIVDGLIHRIRHDLHPGVRRRAFAILWERYREDPRAEETALAAAEDRLAQLRLEAGLALGEAGQPTLLALAESPSTPRGLRRLAALNLPVGEPDLEARVYELLEARDLTQQVVAAELLGHIGGPESLRRLEPLTGRFAARAPLRAAARAAVDRIVARHSNLDAGHLSIADEAHPAGALSSVPDADAPEAKS